MFFFAAHCISVHSRRCSFTSRFMIPFNVDIFKNKHARDFECFVFMLCSGAGNLALLPTCLITSLCKHSRLSKQTSAAAAASYCCLLLYFERGEIKKFLSCIFIRGFFFCFYDILRFILFLRLLAKSFVSLSPSNWKFLGHFCAQLNSVLKASLFVPYPLFVLLAAADATLISIFKQVSQKRKAF
jgi:hypothetical protein